MQPIFVGDVQGCADELDEILARARDAFGGEFTLWVVGDAINRGPANLRVLRRVRELVEQGRARYVLGNHEVSLIETWLGLRPLARNDTFGDVLDARDADDWIDWLRRRPVVETDVLGEQPFAMVHAAAHPEWSLERLERKAEEVRALLADDRETARSFLADERARRLHDTLERLTSCRSVRGDAWSEEDPEGAWTPWHEAWSRHGHDYGVVYGHWSVQGLHVAPGLRGLDTGCVHHGRDGERHLTAWLPDPRRSRPFDLPDRERDREGDRSEGREFWQVRARRQYYGC